MLNREGIAPERMGWQQCLELVAKSEVSRAPSIRISVTAIPAGCVCVAANIFGNEETSRNDDMCWMNNTSWVVVTNYV